MRFAGGFCFAIIALCIVGTQQASALGATGADCSQLCTAAQCAKQKCDLSVPYACVGGSAAGGCSSNPKTFENTTSCTACCDITSCSITCGTCGASACASNPCTATDPYLCTSGADKNGCAPTSGSWSNNPGCQACCDTSTCPKVPPTPAPTPSVVPLNCNVSCGTKCHSADRCPFSAPFMCTAGPEANGCNKKDQWTQPGCTACCDVTLCPQVPCGQCSKTVCKTTQCSATNPYVCTGGTLDGGCSPDPNYWPQNPDCTSCCNFNDC